MHININIYLQKNITLQYYVCIIENTTSDAFRAKVVMRNVYFYVT